MTALLENVTVSVDQKQTSSVGAVIFVHFGEFFWSENYLYVDILNWTAIVVVINQDSLKQLKEIRKLNSGCAKVSTLIGQHANLGQRAYFTTKSIWKIVQSSWKKY